MINVSCFETMAALFNNMINNVRFSNHFRRIKPTYRKFLKLVLSVIQLNIIIMYPSGTMILQKDIWLIICAALTLFYATLALIWHLGLFLYQK